MSRQPITNDRGWPIAYIVDDEAHRITITNTTGWPLGYFYLNENYTADTNGHFVGKGNQLMRLIPQ